MKKKINIFFFISALCLVFGSIVMGVYASVEVKYGLSGNITYNVPDCSVKISCNHITGAGKTENELFANNETIISETVISSSASTTQLPTMYFLNSSPTTVFDITLKFHITNMVSYSVSMVATQGSDFGTGGNYEGINCLFSTDGTTFNSKSISSTISPGNNPVDVYVRFNASSLESIKNLPTTTSELLIFQFYAIA